MANSPASNGVGVVELPADQRERVNHFFDQRSGDLDDIARALTTADFQAIRRVGQAVRESSDGFERVIDLGGQIERAAGSGDGPAVRKLADQLRDYLVDVEVRYVKGTG